MYTFSKGYIYSGLKAFFDVIIDTIAYHPTTTILSLIIVLLALYSITNLKWS